MCTICNYIYSVTESNNLNCLYNYYYCIITFFLITFNDRRIQKCCELLFTSLHRLIYPKLTRDIWVANRFIYDHRLIMFLFLCYKSHGHFQMPWHQRHDQTRADFFLFVCVIVLFVNGCYAFYCHYCCLSSLFPSSRCRCVQPAKVGNAENYINFELLFKLARR